ncbi:PTS sugar transporter subunit IIA [Pectinatus frisingensis]|jgi:PTS system N-acetylgalactosamine-specific IIA component|uniref:PTS sugar transporter subunit IIA n=1 Tax=Pectinatus frisingensis TaxID=865 RepID=UPI0015F510F9|nr:PTS fructose transporter subunit IIA [Pectinatus frisingensis]
MRYIILVSHGEFASGLHSSIKMIAGDRKNLLSLGLKTDMSIDSFAQHFKQLISCITKNDSIILLADIIGGSPLTTALAVLSELNLLTNARAFTGMNLPLSLSFVLNEYMDYDFILNEAKDSIQEIFLHIDEPDDEI